jgi:hypothetical protein
MDMDNDGNEMEKKVTLKGDVFIIPNKSVVMNVFIADIATPLEMILDILKGYSEDMSKFSNWDNDHSGEVTFKWNDFDFRDRFGKSINTQGGSLTLEFQLVQIWATDPKSRKDEKEYSDNWNCHGIDFPKKFLMGWFPSYVPYTLLKDKKEGDTVKFTYDGVDIELTCCQTQYRYARFGKFEDALKCVTHGGIDSFKEDIHLNRI